MTDVRRALGAAEVALATIRMLARHPQSRPTIGDIAERALADIAIGTANSSASAGGSSGGGVSPAMMELAARTAAPGKTPSRAASEAASEVIAEIMVRCLVAGTNPAEAPEILHEVIGNGLDRFRVPERFFWT